MKSELWNRKEGGEDTVMVWMGVKGSSLVGALAGTLVGALVGTLVGTLVGALVGSLVGSTS